MKPTISILEARKILGEKISDKLSDEEIEKLTFDLEFLARYTVRGIRDGTLKIPDKSQDR